eukprot:CAMPEP_0196583148 /NCGR_PEP_ID=MMETSP1081-20130531/42252_1 /TAXON_ID=36882 /ORGANISM="Pyramimonas amylifera, Strain CCMP720" /LENGTH=173 /DNA_ID=CAMNT_0041903943 /DNA_START=61 /DNA_END=579 /DNA_ORIENTATION=-
MAPEPSVDVLVLGLQGGGKSLLVRRLVNLAKSDIPDAPIDFDVVATVGVELQSLSTSKRNRNIKFREVGGAMLPVWAQYLRDCRVLVYVVDMSDPLMLASSAMELYVLLTESVLKDRKVLVLFNKIDQPTVMSRSEVNMCMQLHEMPQPVKSRLTIMEISAVDGTNMSGVLAW